MFAYRSFIAFNTRSLFFITDFGLSDIYVDKKTGKIKRFGVNRSYNGTLKYMSIPASMCMQYTPTDDMYEIGYMLVFLLHGTLPWETEAKIRDKKQRILQTTRFKFLTTHHVSSPMNSYCKSHRH